MDLHRDDPGLPGRHGWRAQRELAASNEKAILAAARSLFRERGVAGIDMRRIAGAAGVGVGTVYRRFGDKTALLAAVIGDDERELQDRVLSGPPPLGPGAPADERLEAFLRALAAVTEDNLAVLLATDESAPGARLRVGAYQVWRLHVATLLHEMHPQLAAADSGWFADALLAPLSPELFAHQRRERRMRVRRIVKNLLLLAAAIESADLRK